MGAAAFLKRSLTEENGRLLARWRAGQAAHPGKLDDYAFCAWGLLELYGVTFRTAYLAEAGDLTARLLAQFFDGKNGGFCPDAAEGERVCAARTMPEELAAFLREASRPELTVLVKTPETAKPLEELAPFTEAYPIPETGVRYYLCRNGACARPVDSISEVRRLLEQN